MPADQQAKAEDKANRRKQDDPNDRVTKPSWVPVRDGIMQRDWGRSGESGATGLGMMMKAGMRTSVSFCGVSIPIESVKI
ncbi:hypothetical protein Tco_1488415 [Tanacetum coccineum]